MQPEGSNPSPLDFLKTLADTPCSSRAWDAVPAMGQEIPEQPDSVEVEGTTVKKTGKTTSYKVSRNDKNIIECTCPSFQVYKTPFKGAGKVRTCKHIKELRGEDAENHRLNVQFNVMPPIP